MLTEVLPALMAREWRHLVDPDDPASVLDVLPARGRESRSWADDVANEPVFRQLARTAVVARCARERSSSPASCGCTPRNRSGSPGSLVRSAATGGMGAPRYGPLAGAAPEGGASGGGPRVPAGRYLGMDRRSAGGRVRQSSAVAVSLGRRIWCGPAVSTKSEGAGRPVVLLEDGNFAAAVPGQVFVRSSPEDTGFQFIHSELAGLPAAVDALGRLGIQVLGSRRRASQPAFSRLRRTWSGGGSGIWLASARPRWQSSLPR